MAAPREAGASSRTWFAADSLTAKAVVSDLFLTLFWAAAVTAGLASATVLSRRHAPPESLRDLLHVGAGVWVFGWYAWERPWVATTIPWAAVVALGILPLLGALSPTARTVMAAVTSEDERWGGVVLYALAFALLTTVALSGRGAPDTAAPALLALAWGDGLGGAVGSRFGGATYGLPWTKRKSWMGSVAVAAATVAGALAWSAWSGWSAGAPALAGAGVVAALAEAVAPRGTDNLAVPAAVYGWLVIVG